MLKYAVIALVVLIALVLVAKALGRRPKVPVAPDGRRMITSDGGAVAAEIAGQELDIDPAVLDDIRKLTRSGNKIEAIKHLREATGLDLTRAKDIVDALERMPQE